jgi:hypothetical protein
MPMGESAACRYGFAPIQARPGGVSLRHMTADHAWRSPAGRDLGRPPHDCQATPGLTWHPVQIRVLHPFTAAAT